MIISKIKYKHQKSLKILKQLVQYKLALNLLQLNNLMHTQFEQ